MSIYWVECLHRCLDNNSDAGGGSGACDGGSFCGENNAGEERTDYSLGSFKGCVTREMCMLIWAAKLYKYNQGS